MEGIQCESSAVGPTVAAGMGEFRLWRYGTCNGTVCDVGAGEFFQFVIGQPIPSCDSTGLGKDEKTLGILKPCLFGLWCETDLGSIMTLFEYFECFVGGDECVVT